MSEGETSIKIIVTGDAANKLPPLIVNLPSESDPAIEAYRLLHHFSSLIEHGHGDLSVSGTPFTIEIPSMRSEYVFVLLPLAYSRDESCYILYVYTIRVCQDYVIEMFQIESCLREISDTLPEYQCLLGTYSIEVYCKGEPTLKSGEFCAGSILYLTQVNDSANEHQEEEEDSIYRNEPFAHVVHTGEIFTGQTKFTGSQLIRVICTKTVLDDTDSEIGDDVIESDTTFMQEVGPGPTERVVTIATPLPVPNIALVLPCKGRDVKNSSSESHKALVHVFNEVCDIDSCKMEQLPLVAKCRVMSSCYQNEQLFDEELKMEFQDMIRNHAEYCYDNQCKDRSSSSSENDSRHSDDESSHSSNNNTAASMSSQDEVERPVVQYGVPVSNIQPRLQQLTCTTLSRNNRTPSDPFYTTPISVTCEPPPRSCISQLPSNLKGYSHGDILFDDGVLNEFLSGNFSPLPYFDQLYEYPILGKGGNGQVIRFPITQRQFALKYTKYREVENKIWSSFQHQNITKLHSVTVVKVSDTEWKCCQIMDCMTGSLRSELNNIGGSILSYLHHAPNDEDLVYANLKYIYKCILNGLAYLLHCSIELQDLKNSNVLVHKTCECKAVFCCKCQQHKYEVQISDFDSARVAKTKLHEANVQYQSSQIIRKSSHECGRELGTVGSRAPEHFVHTNCDISVCGPWCDIWCFGVLAVSQFYLKPQNEELIKNANTLVGKPHCRVLLRDHNQPELILPILQLQRLHSFKYNLTSRVAELAEACLQPDFNQRPSANQLLQHTFFTQ